MEGAIVEPSKIRDYLLSSFHPVGKHKAVFFRSLGYSQRRWDVLARDLRHHARSHEAVPGRRSFQGRKYEVRGSLDGPSGRTAQVVSVWIVLKGEEVPRFITAFPGVRP